MLTVRAEAVHIQLVVGQLEAEVVCNHLLAPLDLVIGKLFDPAAFHANDMIVVFIGCHFEDRMSAFEVVANDQTRFLKLREHAVDGGEADLLVVLDEMLVDILRAEMVHIGAFQNLQDLESRQRDLETRFPQLFGVRGHSVDRVRTIESAQYPVFSRTLEVDLRLAVIILLTATVALTGCSTLRFPGVHRITIQQGNVITQQMIDRLRPGMTKSQVRFVLGNPVVDDPLSQNRWDYFYSIQIAGGDVVRRKLQLYFIDERLSYFEGDFAPTDALETAES